MQHSPGWLLHPHIILTRVHTDPTLARLQITEPRRLTVPDTALHREECWLHAAQCSQGADFQGEDERLEGSSKHTTARRGVKEVLSLSHLLSVSVSASSPNIHPLPLQFHTSKWQSPAQPCAVQLTHLPREVTISF